MTDYQSMTKPELRQAAEQAGLPVSGTKDDLIERLQAAAAQPDEGGLDVDNTEKLGQVPSDDTDVPEDTGEPVAGPPGEQQEAGDQPAHVAETPAHSNELATGTPNNEPVVLAGKREVTVKFPAAGAVTTDMHHQFCHQTLRAATDAGRTARGPATRVGWAGAGENRQAVYRVFVR